MHAPALGNQCAPGRGRCHRYAVLAPRQAERSRQPYASDAPSPYPRRCCGLPTLHLCSDCVAGSRAATALDYAVSCGGCGSLQDTCLAEAQVQLCVHAYAHCSIDGVRRTRDIHHRETWPCLARDHRDRTRASGDVASTSAVRPSRPSVQKTRPDQTAQTAQTRPSRELLFRDLLTEICSTS